MMLEGAGVRAGCDRLLRDRARLLRRDGVSGRRGCTEGQYGERDGEPPHRES
jgi:hypothetical protein